MKKISLILFAVIAMVAGGNAFAQGKYGADSAECIKYLSYYQEYYKQKNYDDALRKRPTNSARVRLPRICSSTERP